MKYKVVANLAYERLEGAKSGELAAAAKVAAEEEALKNKAGHVNSDTETDASAITVILRLRTLYRKSVEYRLAHSMVESKIRKLRLKLAFTHLLLSNFTGAVLFLGLPAAVN